MGGTRRAEASGTTRRTFIGRMAQAGIVLSPLAAAAHGVAAEAAASQAPSVEIGRGVPNRALEGTLTWFHYSSSANPEGEALLAEYQSSHPGVKIELVELPEG